MAKKIVFNVSLTLMVPFIVAGAAVLALMVVDYSPFAASEAPYHQLWKLIAVGGTTFAICALMLYLILQPVRRFLNRARASIILPEKSSTSDSAAFRDELAEIQVTLEQAGLVISRLDAKSLFPEIIGQSRPMLAVLGQILKVAPTTASVLITGETGAGKELVASAIHNHSPRRNGPLVIVNCAAIPENLLESELFGHVKGAFTGAVAAKSGRFELAHQGTLFLDEIGDMPLALQARILRILETGMVDRVGGVKPRQVDVRVVAATNRHLPDLIEQGAFREDLLHRLNVFPLHLPPLRKRREDIPALAEDFLTRYNEAGFTLAPESLNMLLLYDWPGNVRELRNTLERAAVLAEAGDIQPKHFAGLPVSARLAGSDATSDDMAKDADLTLDRRLASLERALIVAALSRAGGYQNKAALILGIKERSLAHRIRKYDIDAWRHR